MKNKLFFKLAGLSGILTVVSFIAKVIIMENLPSVVELEIAEAFGSVDDYNLIFALDAILLPLFFVFLIAAIVFLIIGFVTKEKK